MSKDERDPDDGELTSALARQRDVSAMDDDTAEALVSVLVTVVPTIAVMLGLGHMATFAGIVSSMIAPSARRWMSGKLRNLDAGVRSARLRQSRDAVEASRPAVIHDGPADEPPFQPFVDIFDQLVRARDPRGERALGALLGSVLVDGEPFDAAFRDIGRLVADAAPEEWGALDLLLDGIESVPPVGSLFVEGVEMLNVQHFPDGIVVRFSPQRANPQSVVLRGRQMPVSPLTMLERHHLAVIDGNTAHIRLAVARRLAGVISASRAE